MTSVSSSCKSGSPPVHTTERRVRTPLDGHAEATARASVRVNRTRTPRTVRSDEVCIAEATDAAVACRLHDQTRDCSRQTTEHRWPAGVSTFALKRVEQFLDSVRHTAAPSARIGSRIDNVVLSKSLKPYQARVALSAGHASIIRLVALCVNE